MTLTFPHEGTIEVYMQVIRAICGETQGRSMIDLCCAFAPNTPKLGFDKRHYLDIIDRNLDHPDEQKFFWRKNVLNIHFGHDYVEKFDVAIASDAIEHFYPEDGKRLIDIMKLISHKQIIFTPIGEIFKLHNTGADDPEAHHSLWTPEDFPGWATVVFPNYHRVWNGGAFFAWHCDNIEQDFERVKQIITL